MRKAILISETAGPTTATMVRATLASHDSRTPPPILIYDAARSEVDRVAGETARELGWCLINTHAPVTRANDLQGNADTRKVRKNSLPLTVITERFAVINPVSACFPQIGKAKNESNYWANRDSLLKAYRESRAALPANRASE